MRSAHCIFGLMRLSNIAFECADAPLSEDWVPSAVMHGDLVLGEVLLEQAAVPYTCLAIGVDDTGLVSHLHDRLNHTQRNVIFGLAFDWYY